MKKFYLPIGNPEVAYAETNYEGIPGVQLREVMRQDLCKKIAQLMMEQGYILFEEDRIPGTRDFHMSARVAVSKIYVKILP